MCWLFDGWSLLVVVVECLLYVMRSALFVVGCVMCDVVWPGLLCVACGMLFFVCYLVWAVRGVSFVVCCVRCVLVGVCVLLGGRCLLPVVVAVCC